MRVEKVPHDAGKMDGEKELCYAIDENGNYVTVQSEGWEAKNTTLDQAWDFIHGQIKEAEKKVQAGEQSNIAYWMAVNMMELKLLSDYSGFSKRIIKKHLSPKVFENLDSAVLEKYAYIFKISIDQLIKKRK